jgi:hypothetical protein
MRVFFSGCIGGPSMSGWQRCQAIKDLGHEVATFDQGGFLSQATLGKTVRLLTGKFYDDRAVGEFNLAIFQALAATQPDVAWLEWPVLLRRETLARAARRLPACRLVSFQDDNPFGSRHEERERWRWYLEGVPEYHLHLVKRPTDVCELERLGAKEARQFMHGTYARLFRPLPAGAVPPALRQPVSFVGSPLDHRVGTISRLLNEHRVPLRVYGNRWGRTLAFYRHRDSFRSEVLAEDYVRVICGSRISLGFVSSSNRDEYSMRTFEIPACRGFFLAERTPTHQELFEEGREAEFFDSAEECADKIRFYLKDETARNRIAEGGYRRCHESDYSLCARMNEALSQIATVCPR